jgi:hypothetical protein
MAAFFMAVISVPYVIGFSTQNQEWRYTGLLIGSEDGNSYLAKMMLGTSGDWLFRTPYTAYPQNGFLAFLPLILLGKLVSAPGTYEQSIALFHLFRFSGGIFAIWASYEFIARFIEDIRLRRLGTVLVCAGGGLGFLSLVGLSGWWHGPMGSLPLEFYSPETFGFLALFVLPHLAWARALLLFGLVAYLDDGKPDQEQTRRIVGGLLWLGLGLMQPLSVVVGWTILGAHLVGWAGWIKFRKQEIWPEWLRFFKRALWMGFISAPIVAYTFISFQFDPFLQKWSTQNLIPSPAFTDYLLAYGLVLPLVVVGAIGWWKDLTRQRLFVFIWILIFPILAYLPYNLQRRLPEGVWVAFCTLAVVGLAKLKGRARLAGTVLAGLCLLSTISLFAGGVMTVLHPGGPLFRQASEVNALEYLSGVAKKNEVVLAAYDTSTVIPTRAAVRVIIGHGPESLGLKEIQPRVEAFYRSETPDSVRIELIHEFGIAYVVWGSQERSIGTWNPSESGFLKRIYPPTQKTGTPLADDAFQIFRVDFKLIQ